MEPNKSTHRPYVSADDSRKAYVDATIELLRTHPFPEVTTRKIAEEAGIDRSIIHRHFGTLSNLFNEVAIELSARATPRMGRGASNQDLSDPDFILHTRILAYLVIMGFEPIESHSIPEAPLMNLMEQRQREVATISPKTMRAFNELIALAGEGYILFGEAHDVTPDVVLNTLALVEEIRKILPELEEKLGWKE